MKRNTNLLTRKTDRSYFIPIREEKSKQIRILPILAALIFCGVVFELSHLFDIVTLVIQNHIGH